MTSKSTLHRLLTSLFILMLAVPGTQAAPAGTHSAGTAILRQPAMPDSGLYRTLVTLRNPSDRQRLDAEAIVVLSETSDAALVLADDAQLEVLARLRFEPQSTDELGALLAVQGPDRAWLLASLQPLVDQSSRLQAMLRDKAAALATVDAARSDLRAAMASMTAEQRAGLAAVSSDDEDGDGLTNTQEAWWCTDPLNPDSDNDGRSDGVEIQALKDWMGNRRAGPPGETPWPGWPFNTTTCHDKDHDSIPNLAERELGLNMDRESTDRDKFDDGQELFGVTYCPGGDLSCGYGTLPRSEDSGFVPAVMPSWVKAPGNHPLVAAFPIPEVSVDESSFHVETVTTVTTDHVIESGTARQYSTSDTTGIEVSSSETTTWNEWEENSVTRPLTQAAARGGDQITSRDPLGLWKLMDGRSTTYRKLARGADSLENLGTVFEAAKIIGTGIGYGANWLLYQGALLANGQPLDLDFSPDDYDPNGALAEAMANQKEEEDWQEFLAAVSGSTNLAENGALYASRHDLSGVANPHSPVVGADGRTRMVTGYPMQYPMPRPVVTRTTTQGSAHGGAHTETTAKSESHTITNGEEFSSSESWGNATAQNSAHTADLWFTYTVRNNGTDYARQIKHLLFNVYIGDDPNPACSYFVGSTACGVPIDTVLFSNLMPNEEHENTSYRIPLTLAQMKALDLGATIRIAVEDFNYGADELFYQDARESGLLVGIDDGSQDGYEEITSYLIPTWGDETILDVLRHYFPYQEDADTGAVTAFWTPEKATLRPTWCWDGWQQGEMWWCKHALTTADWWNVTTSSAEQTGEGFEAMPAVPGATVLFRFNTDSDFDGYSDRSEVRLSTLPYDALSHPQPELLAGVHSITSGNRITATLSLLNTGPYDAFGVEAVMIAPNDSITVTHNTVGGSGRVKATQQVVVGNRIKLVTPSAAWQQAGHAWPAVGGYYEGQKDRVYMFQVNCTNPGGCDVGADSWSIDWSDDAGANGSLGFGTGYTTPALRAVGSYGLKVGLISGRAYDDETFTVDARMSRATFNYEILREPHTKPIILVSYNDPQGNHRFGIPPAAAALSSPTANLIGFSGQMLQEPGVTIVSTEPVSSGPQTAHLMVNNPTGVAIEDAHLYLDIITITDTIKLAGGVVPSGGVLAEIGTTADLPAGPSIQPLVFDLAAYTAATTQDYILLAVVTDYQGNVLATGVRPLSSFQVDPKPSLAMAAADEIWDFGTAAQGTVMKRSFTLANTGALDLLTYVSAPAGLSVSQTGSRSIAPGDTTTYQIVLNTADLPVGPYAGSIIIRTSDPDAPQRTVQVVGAITAPPADIPVGAVQRPLDWPAAFTSGTQGQWLEFTHTLGPDPQTLHPVKVYSQDYTTLWGVGKYATAFAAGTASYDMFGDGRDGVMPSSGNLDNNNGVGVGIVNSGNLGTYSINVTDAYGGWRINPGDVVLIHQTQGTGAGCWEFNKAVSDYAGGTAVMQLLRPLQCNYASGGNNHAQVQRVPQYADCPVSGTVTPLSSWNGSWGGIIAVACNGSMSVTGHINANGRGFRGGVSYNNSEPQGGQDAQTGEGHTGPSLWQVFANGNGGGGGHQNSGGGPGGGGGGHANSGAQGTPGGGATPGYGGSATGSNTMSTIFFGGGGGGGARAYSNPGGNGGYGGGIVFINARTLTISGSITANGTGGVSGSRNNPPPENQWGNSGGGGGGSGGAVLIRAHSGSLGTNGVASLGASGGNPGGSGAGYGGSGSAGRIRAEYCETLAGITNPGATTQKLDCYIADRATDPTRGILQIPESGTNTYQVQYGRKLSFSAASYLDTSLRVPAGPFVSVTLQTLVSDVIGSGTLELVIGDPGSIPWTIPVSHAGQYTSPNLAAVFNAYWASHGAPIHTGYLDVPVRATLDRAGQVLLTNLQVTLTGSKLRAIHLPVQPQGYSHVTTSFTVSSGSGPLAVGVDVGDNGSVDWTYNGSPGYPTHLTTGNLAAAVNAYLTGRTGEVDVPVRVILAPFATLDLAGFSTTPVGATDAQIGAPDLSFSPANPMETDPVTVTATLHNPDTLDSGGLAASLFATMPGWGDTLIGSAYVANVPAGGTTTTNVVWNTTGFTGTVPVRMVLDPFNRVVESNETNNQATASLTIRTRPDLLVQSITLSDDEPVAGESVQVGLALRNRGQTAAAASTVAIYDGNPANGGALVCEQAVELGAGAQSAVTCPWGPGAAGAARLFALADRDNTVGEYDEGNNQSWRDVPIGLAGPLLLDSGNGPADPTYDPATGYGAVDEGQPDVLATCGAGAAPEETLRRDPDGRVVYRFDHLLPGHFYHLDAVLYECDGAQRQQSIFVDGNPVLGPINLGDGQPHRFSLRLDPALYANRTISVSIEAPGINGAIVNQIDLHDVDYRYADAGAAGDLAYSAARGYGWLDGVANVSWGRLPYQSVRVDQTDSMVRYRFDHLAASRRYQVNLTLYQGDAVNVVEEVLLDGLSTGVVVDLSDRQPHYLALDVPVEHYRSDGSLVVSVRRTNGSTGAFVNEISLEEKTLLTLPAITALQVSNLSDTSATLSWLTDKPAGSQVHFGASANLGQIAYDDRGATTASRTHHVTLSGLTPSTTYFFYVASADSIDDNAGSLYQLTTGPTLSPPTPDQIYGQVFLPDGVTPATDALVYVTLHDGNGQGSPGDAALLSYVIRSSDSGYWNVNLANARTQSPAQPFQYSATGDQVRLTATDGCGCGAEQVVDTDGDTPAPSMTLTCPTQFTHNLAIGWNLLGLNLLSDPLPLAEQALDDIEGQGGNASELNRWLNGGWDAHIHNLPFNDFALELGKGYFVKSAAVSAWQRAGRPPSNPLLLALTPGWNLIGLPRLPGAMSAEQLLDGIVAQGGNCSEIDRWLNGGWVGHIINLPFNDFPLRTDEGYFVKCNQASTYIPQLGGRTSEDAWPSPAEMAPLAPATNPVISDVLVTNRRDVALTVTWRTDQPSDGWVEYGPTPELGQVAYDDSGEKVVSAVHQVTLTGLQPETAIHFRVHSGAITADEQGQPFSLTTATTSQPTAPFTAYGQALHADGSPAVGALVVARLSHDKDQRKEPFSALVDGAGYWTISLPLDACEAASVTLEVTGHGGRQAMLGVPACALQPASAVRLVE